MSDHKLVFGGYTVDPMPAPMARFAAHVPVNGAKTPELGIGVTACELIVVLVKKEPLFALVVLNRLMTLPFGAIRLSCRSPS